MWKIPQSLALSGLGWPSSGRPHSIVYDATTGRISVTSPSAVAHREALSPVWRRSRERPDYGGLDRLPRKVDTGIRPLDASAGWPRPKVQKGRAGSPNCVLAEIPLPAHSGFRVSFHEAEGLLGVYVFELI